MYWKVFVLFKMCLDIKDSFFIESCAFAYTTVSETQSQCQIDTDISAVNLIVELSRVG